MHSVVDVAGLNAVSRRVLGNAAHAMAGMVQHEIPPDPGKPTLGMTMFGVTTPCVTAVREALELEDIVYLAGDMLAGRVQMVESLAIRC